MLLVEQGASRSRRSMPGISTGGDAGIHFSVPTGSKEKHFRLEGKIVRVMDTGVGINFPEGMDEDAMTSLYSMVSASVEEESAAAERTYSSCTTEQRLARRGGAGRSPAQSAEPQKQDAGAARRAAGISRPSAIGGAASANRDLDLASEKGCIADLSSQRTGNALLPQFAVRLPKSCRR